MASERRDPEREQPPVEGRDPLVRGPVTWPDSMQIARQLGVVVGVGVVWAGLFAGMLRLTSSGSAPAVEGPISAARAERMAAREGGVPATPADSGGTAEEEAAPQAAPTEGPAAAAPVPGPPPAAGPEAPPAVAEAPRQPAAAAPTPAAAETTTRPPTAPPPAAQQPATPVQPPAARAAEPAPEPAPEPVAIPIPGEEEIEEAGAGEVGDVSFARDVMPIFEGRCISCHGGPRREGGQRIEEGLSLLTHRETMAGSTWGPVVVPGDPAGSYLLELILSGEMPDDAPRLLPREIRIITQWILSGAPDND